MENQEKIHRKDGIIYVRKKRTNIYDSNINIRCSKNLINKLKEIAEKNNIGYNTLTRNILEQYVEKEK